MESFDYEIISGKQKNSKLLYVTEQKQIHKKKCVYKKDVLYICYINNCGAKMKVKSDGLCVKAKNFVDQCPCCRKNVADVLQVYI